ncbi:sperm-associated microtubule inner protein 4 [Anableps anableps]
MSKPFSCHMETNSSADFNGDPAWGYGGTIPEHIGVQPCYTSTVRKKSNVRLNDQLIPKPTDINVSEKMIKAPTLKEHPYSSHISRFAVFPSFLSPDDPERGVRAASQSFLNPLIPNKAPDITLLSKTIGGPYRHEILETPFKTKKVAVSWTGENGFFDHPKPVKGETQIFYPAPPKTVLPNPKLRHWDLSLSERTSNMLRNLERKLWITSYQMDFTGSGPANPLKTDDFKEKMMTLRGINSHSAPMRESFCPVFVPSKAKGGHGRRQQRKMSENSYSPNFAGFQMLTANQNQSTASSYMYQQQPQELMAGYNEAVPVTHSQSESKSGFTDAQLSDPSLEILQKQQSTVDPGREEENHKIRFNESLLDESQLKSSEDIAVQLSNAQHFDLNNQPYSQREAKVKRERNSMELQKEDPQSKKEPLRVGNPLRSESHDVLLTGEDSKTKGKELLNSLPNVCILPQPPVFPGIPYTNTFETAGRTGTTLSLLDLQNSFSKSEAHQRFNSSITHGAVNLRDNVVTGKRHSFYGINCNHIHG